MIKATFEALKTLNRRVLCARRGLKVGDIVARRGDAGAVAE